MNDAGHTPDPHAHDDETQPIPPNTEERGKEDASMTETTALTPIRGSNGYQQQISIDPTQPLDLSVTNASGQVRISASDQPNVWVVVRRTDGQHDEEDEVQISVSVEGNRISIRPSWQVGSGLSGLARKIKDQLQNGLNTNEWKFENLKFTPDLNYDIRVEVPRTLVEGSKISAKTASGAIEVFGVHDRVSIASASGSVKAGDLDGNVAIHSASGSIQVKGVTGSLEANTASGSIKVEDGEAWLALRSVSGSISIDRFTMKNARITTVSGGVRGAAIINNVSDYSFETVSGSLNLNIILPADSTSTLNFKSLSGSARVDGAWQSDGKRSWHAGNGGGGPTLRVKTVSGSLNLSGHLESSIPTRHEAMPEPTPPFSSDSDDEMTAPFAPAPMHDHGAPHSTRPERPGDNQPMFTPPADWPDWIKQTARTVEETARHVVTSFQQPVEPLTPPERPAPPARPGAPAQPSAPARPAPPAPPAASAAPWASRPATTPPVTENGTTAQAPVTPPAPAPEPESTARAEADPTPAGASAGTPGIDRLEDKDEAARLSVLEALERGDIDIDEALAQIEQDEPRDA